MYCSNCGEKQEKGQSFCASCGISLDGSIAKEKTIIYALLGWVFTIIAFFFFPPLFGGLAIAFGYLHRKKVNYTHGTILILAGIISAVFGMILGYLVAIA